MDWSDVPGIQQSDVDALDRAGVATAAALAAVEDEGDLARRAGLAPQRVLDFCAAARAHVEQRLALAGITGPEELARADPEAAALLTGLSVSELSEFVAQAQRATGIVPDPLRSPSQALAPSPSSDDSPAPASPMRLPESVLPDGVILREDSSKASVRFLGRIHREIPIVTARAEDDVEIALLAAGPDAVVLQERATLAPARLQGSSIAPLPIFRDLGGTEERVRVARLKGEPGGAASGGAAANEPRKRGLLDRFRRKP